MAGNRRHFIPIIIMDLTQTVIIVNEHITTQPHSILQTTKTNLGLYLL